jgi:hypothetical protein
MLQYSSDLVNIDWLGIDFREGLATGTFIQEARATASWSLKMGARGRGTRVLNRDRSGSLTITIDQESQLHQTLKAVHKADLLSRDKVGPLTLHDESSGEKIVFKSCFIATEPDDARGTESATFGWTFMYEDKETTSPPTLTNVVG